MADIRFTFPGLLDTRMPGVDGFAALAEIRRRSPGTVVVMMSGSTEPALRDAVLRAGADGFHFKSPENAGRLTRELRAVMDARLVS